jgi:Fe-S cluster assembly protein SufD
MKTETILTPISLKEQLFSLYEDKLIPRQQQESPYMRGIRNEALHSFQRLGFPHTKLEDWRSTSLINTLRQSYNCFFDPTEEKIDVNKIFKCDIHHLDTHLLTLVNGWFAYTDNPLKTLADGTIIGSLAAARLEFPEIVEKHYGKYADSSTQGLNALNTAFAQDGIFIYVPDNVKTAKSVQIVNLINVHENILVQPRILVILGNNSRLQLVHCDHSVEHKASFINSVSEVFMGEHSFMDYYKLQNKDNETTLVTTTCFQQETGSKLNSNIITLNGGLIRNNVRVLLNGKGCEASLNGLYLVDKEQHVDNNIFVDHKESDCSSNQHYKGILDDQAQGVFNGHILVRKDAQRTTAYQKNRNILLTDKANIQTQPHLEIYADDVKCSHGATVGQLDPEAMFYMRSRGIREDTSRMLLMYAFAAEVINKIQIPALRHQIDELVYKRLRGELSTCDQCILDCNEKREILFDIDLSKI